MNLTFIIGIVFGFFMIVYGIIMGDTLTAIDLNQLKQFIDIPSILIVVGGTLATVIAGNPMKTLVKFPKHLSIILNQKKFNPAGIIDEVVEFAQIARKNGLLALEEPASQLEDPFFKKSIMLIVDGNDSEKVREMLTSDIDQLSARHDDVASMYEKGSAAAPAFGMIGTLIGLVKMLSKMGEMSTGTSEIGPAMATALITTLYGCILAHLVFNPIANNLRTRDEEECLCRQLVIEGVMAIQSGENPKFIREKLEGYLEQKATGEESGESGKKKKGSRKGKE